VKKIIAQTILTSTLFFSSYNFCDTDARISEALFDLQNILVKEFKTFTMKDLLDELKTTKGLTERELTQAQKERLEAKISFFGGFLYPKDAEPVKELHIEHERITREISTVFERSKQLIKEEKPVEAFDLIFEKHPPLTREERKISSQIQNTPITIAQVLHYYNQAQDNK